jgi:hypothetical protein
MTDETTSVNSGASNPGSLAALTELVDDLIRVDVAGVSEFDAGPLGAEFRVELQELVTAEMKRGDLAPDLATVLAAALTQWASDK